MILINFPHLLQFCEMWVKKIKQRKFWILVEIVRFHKYIIVYCLIVWLYDNIVELCLILPNSGFIRNWDCFGFSWFIISFDSLSISLKKLSIPKQDRYRNRNSKQDRWEKIKKKQEEKHKTKISWMNKSKRVKKEKSNMNLRKYTWSIRYLKLKSLIKDLPTNYQTKNENIFGL
jgi:hypothetical protein